MSVTKSKLASVPFKWEEDMSKELRAQLGSSIFKAARKKSLRLVRLVVISKDGSAAIYEKRELIKRGKK